MKFFVDLAQIDVKAGDGGDGVVSFRHEKYIPRGGPDGGHGGDGGDVFVQASSKLATLYDFTHRHKYWADDGQNGRKQQQKGKSGTELVLEVPVGTVIFEYLNPGEAEARLDKIADLSQDQVKVLIAKAGVGGRGNMAFKSSTNRAPREAEPGTPGEHKQIVLELKVVADVGLIGLPNAGKSTLLAHLTKAKPEIADYPFTTLSPNLGVMEYHEKRIVFADIPGLIEGAAEGKGLGDDFLRHVERTRILVHLIDPLYQDPLEAYRTIRKELGEYSVRLLDKPEIVVVNKVDVTEVNEIIHDVREKFKVEEGIEIISISAATGEGLDNLRQSVVSEYEKIEKELEKAGEVVSKKQDQIPVFKIDDLKHY